jgi:hypothetical protein
MGQPASRAPHDINPRLTIHQPGVYAERMIYTTPAPTAPLTLAQVDEIKRYGGQITYNLDGDRIVSYPAWGVEARARDLVAELYG